MMFYLDLILLCLYPLFGPGPGFGLAGVVRAFVFTLRLYVYVFVSVNERERQAGQVCALLLCLASRTLLLACYLPITYLLLPHPLLSHPQQYSIYLRIKRRLFRVRAMHIW
ncbi:hypothetical protein F4678DRAFT_306568 [Xylaria arbuscula]|nr:hypothetical protein F4678DRAFT_306568 [Xylaria arbuscula]